MVSIREYLLRPHPHTDTFSGKIRVILGVSGFIALFLWTFAPFGLSNAPEPQRLFFALGYGGVTMAVMITTLFGIQSLFPSFFSEERWSVLSEMVFSLLHFMLIGAGNYAFSAFNGVITPGISQFLWFQVITFMVGLIPAVVLVIINQNRLLRKNLAEAERLNTSLVPQSMPSNVHERSVSEVTIVSENQNEFLSLTADQLMYIVSADNYVEVVSRSPDGIRKQLLRNTLKNVEESLATNHRLMRCHRAYIVNLSLIEHVTGNSQGYRITMAGSENVIPVSRSKSAAFRERLHHLKEKA